MISPANTRTVGNYNIPPFSPQCFGYILGISTSGGTLGQGTNSSMELSGFLCAWGIAPDVRSSGWSFDDGPESERRNAVRTRRGRQCRESPATTMGSVDTPQLHLLRGGRVELGDTWSSVKSDLAAHTPLRSHQYSHSGHEDLT